MSTIPSFDVGSVSRPKKGPSVSTAPSVKVGRSAPPSPAKGLGGGKMTVESLSEVGSGGLRSELLQLVAQVLPEGATKSPSIAKLLSKGRRLGADEAVVRELMAAYGIDAEALKKGLTLPGSKQEITLKSISKLIGRLNSDFESAGKSLKGATPEALANRAAYVGRLDPIMTTLQKAVAGEAEALAAPSLLAAAQQKAGIIQKALTGAGLPGVIGSAASGLAGFQLGNAAIDKVAGALSGQGTEKEQAQALTKETEQFSAQDLIDQYEIQRLRENILARMGTDFPNTVATAINRAAPQAPAATPTQDNGPALPHELYLAGGAGGQQMNDEDMAALRTAMGQ